MSTVLFIFVTVCLVGVLSFAMISMLGVWSEDKIKRREPAPGAMRYIVFETRRRPDGIRDDQFVYETNDYDDAEKMRLFTGMDAYIHDTQGH